VPQGHANDADEATLKVRSGCSTWFKARFILAAANHPFGGLLLNNRAYAKRASYLLGINIVFDAMTHRRSRFFDIFSGTLLDGNTSQECETFG